MRPRAVPVVGHPVRLELDDDVDDDADEKSQSRWLAFSRSTTSAIRRAGRARGGRSGRGTWVAANGLPDLAIVGGAEVRLGQSRRGRRGGRSWPGAVRAAVTSIRPPATGYPTGPARDCGAYHGLCRNGAASNWLRRVLRCPVWPYDEATRGADPGEVRPASSRCQRPSSIWVDRRADDRLRRPARRRPGLRRWRSSTRSRSGRGSVSTSATRRRARSTGSMRPSTHARTASWISILDRTKKLKGSSETATRPFSTGIWKAFAKSSGGRRRRRQKIFPP